MDNYQFPVHRFPSLPVFLSLEDFLLQITGILWCVLSWQSCPSASQVAFQLKGLVGMAGLGVYRGVFVKSGCLQAELQELGAIPQHQPCVMGSIEWNPCSNFPEPDFARVPLVYGVRQPEGWGDAKIP